MRALLKYAALLGLAIAIPVLAKEQSVSVSTLAVEPGSAWSVARTAESCDLKRNFGAGKNAIQLIVSRAAGPSSVDITLSGPGVPRVSSQLAVIVDSQPMLASGELLNATGTRASGKPGPDIHMFDVSADMFARIWQHQTLFVAYKRNASLSFSFSNEAASLAALQSCYDDLLRDWHVDAAKLAVLAPLSNSNQILKRANPGTVFAQRVDMPQQPNLPGKVVTWQDYPTEALVNENEGTVLMALSVNETGRADDCRILSSSKVAVLDKVSCQLFAQRGVFVPSKDASGHAQSSIAIERIRWAIPSEN